LRVAALCAAASLGLAAAHGADEAPQTDGEAWNVGVEQYRAGDVTNALATLRPLMLSKTHGARAAEVVAKLAYDAGDLEEAAAAAQIALRAAPDDAKANRNFTRAVDGLPKLREERRVEAVLRAAQGKDPGGMMQGAAHDARSLMEQAATFRTNAPERAVALADALSRRASALADVWIPLRQTIAQAVTNEEQAATILQQIEQAEAKTKKAVDEFGDLGEEAYATMSDVEHDFTRFFKLTAMPPAAIGEDEVAQSNAWQDVEAFNGRAWQQDALDWTRSFRAKFPAWARAYAQKAQSDTNMPPFTAEDEAKVSALATELEKLQIGCVEKVIPPDQEKALGIIRQIRELLPKDKGGGGGGQQQNNQQNQSQDQNQQQQSQDQQKDESQGQDKQDQEPDQKQDQEPEQQPPDEKDGEDQDDGKEEDQEIEATLRKAQERNDEHEAKKARLRRAPLAPNERDW